jgi:hypothetical protein
MSTRWGSKRASMHGSVHQILRFQGGLNAARPSQLPGCAWRSCVRSVTLLAILGLTPAWVATAGDMYRWSDNNGNPVISDRPPPLGVPYTVIDAERYGAKANVVAASPPPSNEQAQRETSSPAGDRQSGGGGGTRVEIEKHPELCDQAKDAIFQLETFARVRVTDKDGTVRFMTDEERAEQLARAREVANANC